jgi:hypothetical protein
MKANPSCKARTDANVPPVRASHLTGETRTALQQRAANLRTLGVARPADDMELLLDALETEERARRRAEAALGLLNAEPGSRRHRLLERAEELLDASETLSLAICELLYRGPYPSHLTAAAEAANALRRLRHEIIGENGIPLRLADLRDYPAARCSAKKCPLIVEAHVRLDAVRQFVAGVAARLNLTTEEHSLDFLGGDMAEAMAAELRAWEESAWSASDVADAEPTSDASAGVRAAPEGAKVV